MPSNHHICLTFSPTRVLCRLVPDPSGASVPPGPAHLITAALRTMDNSEPNRLLILYSILVLAIRLLRFKNLQLVQPPLVRPQDQRILSGLGFRVVVAYQQPRAVQRQAFLRVRAGRGVGGEVENHQVARVLGPADVGPCARVVGVETFVCSVELDGFVGN